MANRFGPPFTDLPVEKRGPGSRLMKDFEGAKKNFEGDSSKSYTLFLPMPSLKHEGIEKDEYDIDENSIILSRLVAQG